MEQAYAAADRPHLRLVTEEETPPYDGEPVIRNIRNKRRKAKSVLDRSERRCWYCGCELTARTLHRDHFVAKAHGGKRGDNIVPACAPCNISKGAKTVEQFRWHCIRKRDDIPFFSDSQREWLEAQGFDFPTSGPFIFAFEREGWE